VLPRLPPEIAVLPLLALTFLGAIFFIACLNTCVGLLSCCSNYFRDTFPVLGYRGWLTVFAVTSTIIANAGLTAILKFSVPVLVAIYPLALVLIILAFLHPFIEKHRFAYPMTMLFTGAAAITAGFGQAGFKLPVLADFFAAMPFAAEGLDWMLPAAVGLVVGIALSLVTPKKAA
ncbi:MAG: branched-chain amino acid transport system II carrier protein, partial [Sutterella wadsworthensis]